MLRLVPFLALLPAPVFAHPHVFVQVDVAVVFDGAGGVAVRLDWIYDAYFSMLVTADLGLDLDGDLQLTPAEQGLLDREIAAWPADFAGDLEVVQAGNPLPLGAKRDHAMVYRDGLMRETHLRPVTAIADRAAVLEILPYDPSYYVAYSVTGPVRIEGRSDCTAEVIPADLDAAYSLVEEMLYGRPAPETGEDYFPQVGRSFADTVVVSCAGLL